MAHFQGKVNNIDAQAIEGLEPRCQVFITNPSDEIQVTTNELNLQSALSLACLKNVEVEITYDEALGLKMLRRVKVLDRI